MAESNDVWAEARKGFSEAIAKTSDEPVDEKEQVDAKPADVDAGKELQDEPKVEAQPKPEDEPKLEDEPKVEAQPKPEDEPPAGQRPEKRIKQLLTRNKEATSRAEAAEARSAELLEELKALKAKPHGTSTTGDAEIDADLEEILGKPEGLHPEVVARLEAQEKRINALLEQSETAKLTAQLDALDAEYPDVPKLRTMLINAVKHDPTVDLSATAEAYKQYVDGVRSSVLGIEKAAGDKPKGEPTAKSAPHVGGKGKPLSSGAPSKPDKPITWDQARSGFAEMIRNG